MYLLKAPINAVARPAAADPEHGKVLLCCRTADDQLCMRAAAGGSQPSDCVWLILASNASVKC